MWEEEEEENITYGKRKNQGATYSSNLMPSFVANSYYLGRNGELIICQTAFRGPTDVWLPVFYVWLP